MEEVLRCEAQDTYSTSLSQSQPFEYAATVADATETGTYNANVAIDQWTDIGSTEAREGSDLEFGN